MIQKCVQGVFWTTLMSRCVGQVLNLAHSGLRKMAQDTYYNGTSLTTWKSMPRKCIRYDCDCMTVQTRMCIFQAPSNSGASLKYVLLFFFLQQSKITRPRNFSHPRKFLGLRQGHLLSRCMPEPDACMWVYIVKVVFDSPTSGPLQKTKHIWPCNRGKSAKEKAKSQTF